MRPADRIAGLDPHLPVRESDRGSAAPTALLGWETLWGGRLPLERPSRWLLVASSAVAGLLVAVRLSGWNPARNLAALEKSLGPWPPDVVHLCAELGGGLLLLLVGAYFLAWSAVPREATVAGLGSLFATSGMLEILHGTTSVRADSAIEPAGILWTWTVSRTWLALGLVAVLWWGRYRSIRARRALAGGILLGGFAAAALLLLGPAGRAPDLLRPAALLPRPWELVPLALLLFATVFLLAPVHRRLPSPLTHALIVAMIPSALAQLSAALGWMRPWDADYLLAHALKHLATLTLAAGLVIDGVVAHRRRLAALEQMATTESRLNESTAALEQVDRDLVREAAQRRKAERSLKLVEKAISTMSLGATITDPRGRILFVNAAEAAMHGYEVEELVGRQSSIFAPKGRTRQPPAATLEGWEPWTRESLNVTRDGRTFPVRLVSDAVLGADGSVLGLVTICEDISERREIESALERRDRILQAIGFAAERLLAGGRWEAEVEEILRRLGESTSVDRVRFVSAGDERDRVPSQEWLGPWSQPGPPLEAGDLVPWMDVLRRGEIAHLPSPGADTGEEEAPPLDRLVVPVLVEGEWRGALVFETADEHRWTPPELAALEAAARTLAAAIQHRLAEAALAESEGRFRLLLENASDLVQQVDETGRLLFVNHAWRETLGYPDEPLGELRLEDLLEATSHDRFLRALGSSASTALELELRASDGRRVLVEGTATRSDAEGAHSCLAILRDVTEKEHLRRMKNEFVTVVSHELRTPLTSLIASLSILRQDLPDREREEMLDICDRNGERLLHLIDDLLDLQRLSAGRLPLRPEAVPVGPLLAEARARISTLAADKGIRLEARAPRGLEVRADRRRLAQVLDNLLSNAIKFSPAGSTVHLDARCDNGACGISVADEGPGIPETYLHQLFEPFSQHDASSTRQAGGTGLGLHIVRALVEAMGGEVDVETSTEPPASGSTFEVLLPAVGRTAAGTPG